MGHKQTGFVTPLALVVFYAILFALLGGSFVAGYFAVNEQSVWLARLAFAVPIVLVWVNIWLWKFQKRNHGFWGMLFSLFIACAIAISFGIPPL